MPPAAAVLGLAVPALQGVAVSGPVAVTEAPQRPAERTKRGLVVSAVLVRVELAETVPLVELVEAVATSTEAGVVRERGELAALAPSTRRSIST